VTQSSPEQVSLLLQSWRLGNRTALDRLVPLVYDELHRIAYRYMRAERVDQTLQTTALVHEAYLRLVDIRGVEWQDRAHFFAISAKRMQLRFLGSPL
jgi:RNA polymerase sigma-70 factor (ECF subfamily)